MQPLKIMADPVPAPTHILSPRVFAFTFLVVGGQALPIVSSNNGWSFYRLVSITPPPRPNFLFYPLAFALSIIPPRLNMYIQVMDDDGPSYITYRPSYRCNRDRDDSPTPLIRTSTHTHLIAKSSRALPVLSACHPAAAYLNT
ncbi:hypothetical protein FN846DRAFT_483205 [Sphaerosporella brunnea]|uniref:Uncharacterized protein n=1 Tax=Sphaerosporella brunnea TaxID=1250544 RepID=A0A5J5FAQ3_9PEZI|nr:hypothetical protein FN846DRAFT_483205 [Sphaerosporella brunnea]